MNSLPLPSPARRNLAEHITAELRQAIVSGQIRPGTPLAEPVLAAQYQASRAPIREALIALERDGLVEFNERSRTRVRSLTREDFQEICSMRIALESLAARLAAEKWTAVDSAAIAENVQRQETAVTLGELSRLDVEMHESIVRRSGHRRLLSAWLGIRGQFEMGLAYTHRLQDRLDFDARHITVNAHHQLLAALASGKPALAERTMAAHIESSLEWSLTKFPTSDIAEAPKKRGTTKMAATVLTLLALFIGGNAAVQAEPTAEDQAFFDQQVRPLLEARCYECHSHEKKIKGGLVLDSRSGWEKGGDTGSAVVPGKPEESLLIKAISHTDKDLAMPPKKKLSDAEIAVLTQWVKIGAPDPRVEVAKGPAFDYATARRQWAFHKPEPVTPPEVKNAGWAQSPIDRLILAKLEAKGLAPAPPAERRTLLRRATFDLTGLPPTPQEMEDFLADSSPNAFAKVVDRLLASPRYGERWARHWLDVVRYTDSFDSRVLGKDGDITLSWRYRDWVVNAFNRDLPYDQFITQQVAGDLLAEPAGGPFDPEKIVATGLYAIGNWGNGDADKEKAHTDIIDDQIDVTGRAFLGLTLACARCHDHKFDPISTADYYGLAGIFFSSRIIDHFADKTAGEKPMRITLLPAAELAQRTAQEKRLAEIDARLALVLPPLDKVTTNLKGEPNVTAWHLKRRENPSVTINRAEQPVELGPIKLPGRSIALHPGEKDAVTAGWRSPIAGRVKIEVRLHDANDNCGDGIEWAVRNGSRTLGTGVIDNGGGASFSYADEPVAEADLVQLIIRPRENYQCDSTEVDFVITAADGQKWDLRETLVGGATNGSKNLWWLCGGEGERLAADRPDLKDIRDERVRLVADLATPPPMCHGLQEGGIPDTIYAGIHDARIHTRGRYDRLGDLIPRHFPTLLAGDSQEPIHTGSGRLELARWLASAENPLTARVLVNRLWQHHFGEGLVRTPNNFGKLGTPPTHPELLDWLAEEFVRSGWSIKAMQRLIMNSAVYQQASAVDLPEDREASTEAPSPTMEQIRADLREDAANLLFGRQNRRRLEAEALRDTMLFTAGQLDLTTGGPTALELTGPRRTLYITTVRSDRATYQMLFDAADPTGIVEKRVESTVAPQALWLLNHPFALNEAMALAAKSRDAAEDDAGRIAWLYETLFSRPPTAREVALGEKAVAAGDTAWTAYCQILYCTNEFIYLD